MKMNIGKYLAIDRAYHGSNFDEWVYAFDSLGEANDEAERLWNHLTKREQKNHTVCVGFVTEEDLYPDAIDEDGEIEWAAHHSYSVGEGFFNSATLAEEEE